jgi:hypothetical protein
MNRFKSSRDAVTIIEVLFATGIAIFGLIGIASLIGVAGKQASQSNAATVSQALANQWFGDFVVRGFNASPNWRVYNDQITPAPTLASRFISFDNSSALASGTSSGGTRPANRHAICVDPLFFADPSNLTALLGSFPNTQAYRPGLFPYYQDNLNPLSDPFTPVFYTTAPVNRPRLLRVGLHDPSSALETLTSSQVNRLFLSFDDQIVTVANIDDPTTVIDERDPSAAATRRLAAGGGQFASNGEYSWFATLCPRELLPGETTKPENLYTMSLVVTKRRDRVFFQPTATGVDNIPNGERIAYVSRPGLIRNPATGDMEPQFPLIPLTLPLDFQGGSGGRVLLSGSLNTSSKLGTGDWIMLSRYQPIGGSVVVRWYRVIGLDAKPTETGTFWSREVSLDGPDWVFDATTQATLVSNVVTVFERVVEVQH